MNPTISPARSIAEALSQSVTVHHLSDLLHVRIRCLLFVVRCLGLRAQFFRCSNHYYSAEDQREDRQNPHPRICRFLQNELAVRLLEVREDLLLRVAFRDHVAHLMLHVLRDGGRRIGDRHSLTNRASQQRRHFLCALIERGSGKRLTLRDAECDGEKERDHSTIALATLAWRMSGVIGPTYFA